jgi:hypothetical protein
MYAAHSVFMGPTSEKKTTTSARRTSVNGDLSALRKKALAGSLDPVLEAVLNAHDPDWKMNPSDRVWQDKLERYREFLAENRRAPSTKSEDSVEKYLGVWVSDQRTAYKRGTLDRGRVDRLEAVIGHCWDFHTAAWDSNLERYREFLAENRRAPSTKSEDSAEKDLGKWVSSQRTAYKSGTLDRDRVDRLEAVIGHCWDLFTAAWDSNLERYREFLAENRRAPSTRSEDSAEKDLGMWVSTQRTAYKSGTLDRDRVDRLEAVIGHCWDLFTAAWDSNLERYRKFLAENRRAPSTKSEDSAEKDLGMWVSSQRTAYKSGTLDRDRVDRLEAVIGHCWDLFTAAWDSNLERYRKFLAENRRAPSTTSAEPAEKELGVWGADQRRSYKRGTLDRDRINRLEAVTGHKWSLRSP